MKMCEPFVSVIVFISILLYSQYTSAEFAVLDLSEGSKCEYDKYNGTCIKDYYCLSMIKSIKEKTYPPICSYALNTPIVCCTDCNKDRRDIRNATFIVAAGLLFKNGHKAHDICIDYLKKYPYHCKEHILGEFDFSWSDKTKCTAYHESGRSPVGGKNAVRGEFPHMALLGYGSNLNSSQWLCGGSLISEHFILTAAHCIYSAELGPVKHVALGILKRSDPIELWRIHTIKSILPHPGYKSPLKYYDIALLQTDTAVKIDTLVLPACLLNEKEQTPWAVHATGWGYLGAKKPLADILQKVWLKRFSDEECDKLYPVHRHLTHGYDKTTQVCYGDHEEAKDTCNGDSGGPLQDSAHRTCQFRIFGVTSSGLPCGKPGAAGLYTRVEPYLPWIESIVWP